MSGMHLLNDRITQSLGDEREELGYIGYDRQSKTYVLWLKDIEGDILGNPGGYVRGDQWNSLEEAREMAMQSPSAMLLHMKWLRSLKRPFGFLAMEFGDPQLERLAKDHIKPTIQDSLGCRVVDMRDISEAGLIDQQMRAAIAKSRFVIADLTHDNSGAYWEAGVAEGHGIPVVYICEETTFTRSGTHFDTNHFLTVLWSLEKVTEFENELIATLKRTLGISRD